MHVDGRLQMIAVLLLVCGKLEVIACKVPRSAVDCLISEYREQTTFMCLREVRAKFIT